MANQPKTPLQNLRVDPVLWDRFGEAVRRADPGSDRSKTLRQFLAWFVHEPGVKLPARPPAAES
jgi:hypothetical protein